MILLLSGLAVLMVAAAVTIYAVLTAKDGYEDQTGFHALTPAPVEAKKSMGGTLPPFATAR